MKEALAQPGAPWPAAEGFVEARQPRVVGLLFVVMGNFLGKVRKNFFLGIRTPWTLASDEVWAKTHRLGGWCFVTAGVFMAIMGVVAPTSTWFIAAIIAIALIPVVYSFFAYRKIEGFAPDPEIDEE